MAKHITLAAVLNIGIGVLAILTAVIVFIIMVATGLASGDPTAITVTSIVGSAIAVFLVIVSVPQIVGGIGLLKRKSWSRILMLVVSVLQLLNIPLGTALGIYTIWVLIQDESKQLLEGATPQQ